jgi:membrane protease YdiL (CAAX protease family)
MDPHLFDHLLVMVLVAAIPVRGVVAYRTLRRDLERGVPDARPRAYRRALLFLWGLAGLLVVGWGALGRSWAALGLAAPSGALSWGVLALAAALGAYQLLAVRAVTRSPGELEAVAERVEHLAPLLPADDREWRWFAGLGVTAGITEELLFRGFLIAYLAVWVGLWPAVLLSSVAFGVGHVYQAGLRSAIQTGIAGLVFGTLYALAGQLWGPMILHAAVDLGTGWAARRATGARDPVHGGPRSGAGNGGAGTGGGGGAGQNDAEAARGGDGKDHAGPGRG